MKTMLKIVTLVAAGAMCKATCAAGRPELAAFPFKRLIRSVYDQLEARPAVRQRVAEAL